MRRLEACAMDLFFKTIVAFLIGVGALVGVQHLWVSSMMSQVRSQSAALPTATPFKSAFGSVDADKLRAAILPKFGPIDTTTGQRLAIEGAQRRIDMQIRNAQSYTPVYTRGGIPSYRR
jgi:hypothetical protein